MIDKVQESVLKLKLMNLAQSGQFVEAEKLSQYLLQNRSDDVEVWFSLGQIQRRLGKLPHALSAYARATQKKNPNYTNALVNAVDICITLDLLDQGFEAATKLIEVAPKLAVAQYQYAFIQLKQKKYGAAEKHFKKAVKLDPKNPAFKLVWAESLAHMDDIPRALGIYQQLTNISNGDDRPFWKSLLFQNYCQHLSDDDIFKAHAFYGKKLEQRYSNVSSVKQAPQNAKDRIKVGYVSPDFRSHSVSYFISPILHAHDRNKIEVYCYSDVVRPDEITKEIKALSEHWVEAFRLDDEKLYAKIREDKIDILVDLNGYMGDRPRMGVFARKAAPVQMTYLGYPNTSGLTRMDYRLVDSVTDPVGVSERWCTETLLRMPHSFLCFLPEKGCSELQVAPASKAGAITFGSFNAYLKITDDILRAWAEILRQVANSKIYIKAEVLADSDQKQRFLTRCAKLGIDASKLILAGQTPSRQSHLDEYHKVDLHLDTFPYNGTTTTLEAMWMGVPTITLAGLSHRSRVGASILSALDMKDYIADSAAQYIDVAVAKAMDIEALASVRQTLRIKMTESALADTGAFVKELEQHYQTIAK